MNNQISRKFKIKEFFKIFSRKSSKDSCVIYEDWEFLQQYPDTDKRSRSNVSKSTSVSLLNTNRQKSSSSIESLPLTETEIFDDMKIGKTSTLKTICSENYATVANNEVSDIESYSSNTINSI